MGVVVAWGNWGVWEIIYQNVLPLGANIGVIILFLISLVKRYTNVFINLSPELPSDLNLVDGIYLLNIGLRPFRL
jgi:hypothetical protein